jgi:hypothetical protein
VGLRSAPTISAVASGTTTIAARYGVQIADVTKAAAGGTETVTAQYGIDIDALSNATTNVGIRNADTYVATPTTQALSGDSDTISPTAEVICLTATANRDLTSNPQIAAGISGQVLEVWNCDSSTETVKLDDGTGLVLAGATAFTLNPGDMIRFRYMTAAGVTAWHETNRADNN